MGQEVEVGELILVVVFRFGDSNPLRGGAGRGYEGVQPAVGCSGVLEGDENVVTVHPGFLSRSVGEHGYAPVVEVVAMARRPRR